MASSSEGQGVDGLNNHSQSGPSDSSPLAQPTQAARFNEEFDASRRGSSLIDGPGIGAMQRTSSGMSQSQTLTPSRGGTLKKRQSLKRGNSLRRSSSHRSIGAGSVKSLNLGDKERYEGSDFYSAFHTPIPTRGSPTDILSNRFQDWRRVLKDLISYFREVQKSHESRSKSLLALSNLASNISGPPGFLKEGGIADATNLLKEYHKKALSESNKAKTIEEDIMQQLTGLRSDLAQKIKEIKSLSGDFKNSCDKETDGTRKAVRNLQEALGLVDSDPGATSGKGDPFIVRLGVERQVERQIDEENYLHKAFLNLEHSGRELESIVVGEIQKAYNAYAGILKREADEAYEAVESLRMGPVMMPKDAEWDAFVNNNDNFVDPRMPLRKPDQITYPGKDAPAAAEVRSGMLERKSKYLKSYTPGWYVLSPTHLHEFKSPDHLSAQAPVMSLYLQEQKLGSHSNPDSSSHKFMLKGRQTGGMHRGHGWVFRAESRDTMLAWFEDIKSLTEKTGMERDAFVRRHARSTSRNSMGALSISSDGAMEEDEADQVPYSGQSSQLEAVQDHEKPQRPQPGGRFPSDLNVDHNLQMPLSSSSGASSDDPNAIAAATMLPGSQVPPLSPALAHSELQPVRGESYRAEPYMQPDDDLYTSSQPVLGTSPETEQHPSRVGAQQLTQDTHPVSANNFPAEDAAAVSVESPHQEASKFSKEEAAVWALGQSGTSDSTVRAQEIPEAPPSATNTATVRPIFIPDLSKTASPLAENPLATPLTTETTVTTLSDASLLSHDHIAFGAGDETRRPPLTNQASEQTISNLHVPGGFPKAANAVEPRR